MNYLPDWPYVSGKTNVTFYPLGLVLSHTGKPPVSVRVGFMDVPYHNLKVDDFAKLVVYGLNRTRDFNLTESQPASPIRLAESINTTLLSHPFATLFPVFPALQNIKNFSTAFNKSINSLIHKPFPILGAINLTKKFSPAYELVYTSGGNKTMVVYTVIDDEFVYYAKYVSPVGQYEDYLQGAQVILSTLKIHESEVEALKACRLLKANPGILNSFAGFGTIGSAAALAGNGLIALC